MSRGLWENIISSFALAYLCINYQKTNGHFPREHHLICQYRSRGEALGNSFLETSSSARAYLRINYEDKRKLSKRASRDLPIKTTWWYPKEQFIWNFIFCTCICTHELWKDKRKLPRRASRDQPIQTTWWYPKEKFLWNFIFCTCICTHKLWQKEISPESITWSANADHVVLR